MSNIVRQWYESKENVEEMVQWNKGKLKKWEQYVIFIHILMPGFTGSRLYLRNLEVMLKMPGFRLFYVNEEKYINPRMGLCCIALGENAPCEYHTILQKYILPMAAHLKKKIYRKTYIG